jgi:hypothetical protein
LKSLIENVAGSNVVHIRASWTPPR